MSESNIPMLKNLRSDMGVSQPQLAEALGVSSRTVIRWEMGYSDPTLGDMKKIAAYFGVSVSYLIGESHQRNLRDQSLDT